MEARESNTDPTKRSLLDHNARGSFTPDFLRALNRHPTQALQAAQDLLDAHFPRTLHEDILAAVGLDLEGTPGGSRSGSSRRPRDPRFRERVLITYEYRCAVCSLDLRMGNQTVALEAAHIQWHQAGGPDVECNGLALCILHHKVFDHGAFRIEPDLTLLVSDRVHGSEGMEASLLRFHGTPIRPAQRREHRPATRYLEWSWKQVFKGEPRPITS